MKSSTRWKIGIITGIWAWYFLFGGVFVQQILVALRFNLTAKTIPSVALVVFFIVAVVATVLTLTYEEEKKDKAL